MLSTDAIITTFIGLTKQLSKVTFSRVLESQLVECACEEHADMEG